MNFNLSEYSKSMRQLLVFDVLIKEEVLNKDAFLSDLIISPTSYRRAKIKEQNVGNEIVLKLAKHFKIRLVSEKYIKRLEKLISKIYFDINYRVTDRHEQYLEEMNKLSNQLKETETKEEWEAQKSKISEFQWKHMKQFLEDYRKAVDSDAKQSIYELFAYAVRKSCTGNSIIDVDTKEESDAIEEILWDEIGDYLLDCEFYEENGRFTINAMFGGYYVPDWDGWDE